ISFFIFYVLRMEMAARTAVFSNILKIETLRRALTHWFYPAGVDDNFFHYGCRLDHPYFQRVGFNLIRSILDVTG
ncbi:MAG TPA: hypothetical protein VKU37_14470, partial [Verrucomicrobiae bacterium]|nr:hypothetical protein [Verrucomicrobiae bacterium]